MDFEIEAAPIRDGTTMLVSVYGELDLATCGELAHVAEEITSPPRPVILDLTECPFIDSSGLRAVLHVSGIPDGGDGQGAPVAIVSVRGSATGELFALTGVDKHLKLFGTVDDAIAWLDAKPKPDGEPSSTPPIP